MVRGNTQRQHLASDLPQQSVFPQLAPEKLSAIRRVIDLASESLRVDEVLVIVLIQKRPTADFK
jgi:hypothetical protein